MSSEEFLKQQYLTLRDEIRACKARVFIILVLCVVLVPLVSFAAAISENTFAIAGAPFILLVLMMAFIMEQNGVIRAGKYLKEHVEPRLEGHVTWEAWLETNNRYRMAEKFYFVTFLMVFLVFYAIQTGLALQSLAQSWPGQELWVAIAYGVGALWFIVVWLRHWHSCTSTD